ncbi:Uncharacterised protein [Mycobacteroides abscessus subsp. abscessus]|nr:Uncharacterised protein [Mycobacteroides abscessus subsp. abscessus]SHZ18638.1 Uncharacterised protein [Mycobacteroides abscessus subsp. abscessus]SHZ46658.1 Uncharacterised protein [Mycobacteroides abscessus subsp. abscessus]SID96237.1 Uncharacterised protein [Mycobacteroides abscessus subsp. abscessus]SIE53515.1 Uncharacterised protein [Mycobacteroides abscessus subsp. abscessus]
MTAVAAADEALVNRADQLQKLRQQMAAISGKVGGDRSAAGHFPEALPDAQSLLPGSDALARSIGHVLRRGTVAVAGGARSLPLEVVASVTAAGGYAAIVGMPEVSVLAAVERGGGPEPPGVDSPPGPERGGGGLGAHGWDGSGGAGSGRAPGDLDVGPRDSGPGAQQRVHAVGCRRGLGGRLGSVAGADNRLRRGVGLRPGEDSWGADGGAGTWSGRTGGVWQSWCDQICLKSREKNGAKRHGCWLCGVRTGLRWPLRRWQIFPPLGPWR